MADIHETAIVDKGAELADDVIVGPYCIIGGNVKIGSGTVIQNNVVIEGNVEIGENCKIFPFATIGLAPQDIKYSGEPTGVKIGNNNTIREFITIHRGSVGGDGYTKIGNNNFLMAYVHIAHDCVIGDHVIMANAATLAGHVEVGDYAVISGLSAVHQFARVGSSAMVSGLSGVIQDIPPFTIASGTRAKLYGLNLVGLKRRGFSSETISELKKAYRILFRSNLSLKEGVKKVQAELPYTDEIAHLIEFINKNRRGITRAANKGEGEEET
ncbi:MAG: acyl-ACP--UDP-N-acetylglucosamine O-acyltransferase [Nitrospirae bacterium]|nr:MAG: acyl-ACP--UDP-N-acetylglucosamine O-acyltransferase [Nitrospirota bacterium]